MFGHVTHIENLNETISKLRKQLEKVLDAIGIPNVDVPCPSSVGLEDTLVEGFCTDCRSCWENALNEMEGEEVKC